jgi:homospermidine synthase
VSSIALIRLCQEIGVIYLDTCIEPWKGYYTNSSLSVSERSNYALREQAIKLKKEYPHGTTALIACGANPGIISPLTKQAILNIAKDLLVEHDVPKTRQEWAALANKLDIKTIHIAEYDWQKTTHKRPHGDFHNTWSGEGFISEGLQPSELGWGTHEKALPQDGHEHTFGEKSSIYLDAPGFSTRVRSWTPLAGPYQGNLVTHNEAISISNLLTLHKDGKVIYRPTVHYAYRPFDDAVLSMLEMEGRNMTHPKNIRVIKDDIDGIDELGVLLMGHKNQSYWFGSHLSSEEARKVAPHN